MSKKNTITLTPATRKTHRAEFVKANPWTPGKTLSEIRTLVESGKETLKGNFAFPDAKEDKTKKARVAKSDSPTVKANKKAKAGKKGKARTPIMDPEFRAKIEEIKARKEARRKAAKWMHKNGIHPRGAAWTEVLNGERDLAILQGLNDQDGYSKHPNRKEVTTAVVADVAAQSPARKRPHRKNGSFMSKEQTETFFKLVDSGVDESIARTAAEALA